MADTADIIREYLVSLGFRIDQNSLNKMDNALAKTAKAVLGVAGTLAAVGAATTKFVDHVAENMEDLYWASVRLRDSVPAIQDFQLGISKVGGTAEQARAALTSMANALRFDPSAEARLATWGVKTRDISGNLRSSKDLLLQLAHLPLPEFLKANVLQSFGITNDQLVVLERYLGDEKKVSEAYAQMGIDAQEAGEQSKNFENQLRDLDATLGVVAVALEKTLLPFARGFVTVATTLITWLGKLDKATDGWASTLLYVAIAAGGVFLAFGWIPALITGLGLAATAVIGNWDKVKATISAGIEWLRGKYNAVAKFLGLPQWGAGAPPTQQPRANGPDYRKLEENKTAFSNDGKTPLGVRYNNPGNLQPGGQEAYYDTPQQGLLAMAQLLHRYSEKGLNTVSGILNKYAPTFDKFGRKINDTAAYIGTVTKEMGVGADQALDLNDPAVLQRLMGAMIRVEQGMRPYSEGMIGDAAARALGKPLSSGGRGNGNVTINQKNNYQITGSDPNSTARAVGREQNRTNGDLVRNFAGAQS